MIFYLVVIFALILVSVLESAPKPKTPPEQQQLLEVHESILYFIDAELMAKQIAPDPSLRWSHDLVDNHTGCTVIGNGVWYARGTIAGGSDPSAAPSDWEAYFLAEGRVPLFVRVGNMGAGDERAARQRAGYGDGSTQGAPGGR